MYYIEGDPLPDASGTPEAPARGGAHGRQEAAAPRPRCRRHAHGLSPNQVQLLYVIVLLT